MKLRPIASSTIATAALVALLGSPSLAATSGDGTSDLGTQSVVSERTFTSTTCLEALKQAMSDGVTDVDTSICTKTVTLSASQQTPLTRTELKSLQNKMNSGEYSTLSTSVIQGTAYKKSFTQTVNNGTDRETQYGTFYYDPTGYRVWVNSHVCKLDYAVAYGVTNSACSDSGTNLTRDIYAQWHFAVGFKGSPVAWDEIYHIHVYRDGSIYDPE